MRGHVLPSINARSFSCPVCGALSSQQWFSVFAIKIEENHEIRLYDADEMKSVIDNFSKDHTIEEMYKISESAKNFFRPIIKSQMKGLCKIEEVEGDKQFGHTVYNLNLSNCFSCKETTVWVHDKIVNPITSHNLEKPEDLPPEAEGIFDEAAAILEISPRASAALLRLCVQIICEKICDNLGAYKKGMTIDKMIQTMHEHGLSQRLKDSLDIVRIKGNDAVHEIVLTDNKETAVRLFKIISTICNQMITSARLEEEMYESLPENARKAIEKNRPKSNASPSAKE